MEEVDIALVLRHAAAADDGGARIAAEVARLAALAAEHDVALIAWEPLANHYDAEGYFRDHFDLRDNFSQPVARVEAGRSEEHTSELQSLMRNSYAVFWLKKTNQ